MDDDAVFCGACGSRLRRISASAPVVTPVVERPFIYAAFPRRAAAYCIDLVLATALAAIAGFTWVFVGGFISGMTQADHSEHTSAQDDALTVIATWLLLLGGFAGFLTYQWVATALGGGVGKRILRLRIVRDRDGAAPGWRSAFARVALHTVLAILTLGTASLLGSAWALWDKQRRTWYDMAAGTIVVDFAPASASGRDMPADQPATSERSSTGIVNVR